LIWSYVKAGGFNHMFSLSSRLTNSEFLSVFFPSLTANISFWATVALNIPDFTRYAKSQKDQVIGQIGLPIFMGLFTFVGLVVTSSTKVIFGEVISNPIQLLGKIGGFTTSILAIIGISLATLTTNIAANVVAPANALVNLNPSWFTFRRGAFLTAILGIAFQPWRLLKSSESFVYTWLVGYSALMGPIGGIVLVDYYVIKKMELRVSDLYTRSPFGAYYYSKGFNVAAIVALVVGILPVVPGFLHKVGIVSSISNAFVVIYNNAWFISFFSAGFLYWILLRLSRKLGESDALESLLPDAN
jgi:NCS1 family nucleobase:cation symporter-1